MKKLLCLSLALLGLTGCSENPTVLVCKYEKSIPDYDFFITVYYEYEGKKIIHQTQDLRAVASSETRMSVFYDSTEAEGFKEKTKGMEGVTYELKKDVSKLVVTEKMDIDLTVISSKEYQMLSNGIAINNGNARVDIEVDQTIKAMEMQDFTCKK